MAGHRRISTDLFLELRRESRQSAKEATPIEALLELDLDAWRGKWPPSGPPVKTYARLWGWTPGRTRRLIARWKAHENDLGNVENAENARTPGVPSPGPSANPQANPQSEAIPDACDSAANPPANPSRTPGEPSAYPFLEPEPEPEGERGLPRKPSALGVGAAESRVRQARAQVSRALMRLPAEKQEPVGARLDVLAEMFLAAGRVADEAQLRAYCRGTARIPRMVFKAACDEAFASSENGWPPSVHAINAAGKRLETQARKLARGSA